MTIFELDDKVQKVYEIISLKDTSFEARTIVDDLKNLSLYLENQDDNVSYNILLDEKYFRAMIRNLFPTAPIGFANYYNNDFNTVEKDQLSSLQDTLHKIYNEIDNKY